MKEKMMDSKYQFDVELAALINKTDLPAYDILISVRNLLQILEEREKEELMETEERWIARQEKNDKSGEEA